MVDFGTNTMAANIRMQGKREVESRRILRHSKPGLAAHGITLHYGQPALADIVAESSTKYGARELRRTIRKTIEDPVSEALVDGRLDGREVTLELADHDGKAVLEI